MKSRITRLCVLLALVVPAACDRFGEGELAYREGRYEDALAAFAAAEAQAGDAASAELLWDRALAAMRVGRLREAEWCLEKAVARGLSIEHDREFLSGNIAFARCERAEAETLLTDPDPTAFSRAITHAQAAHEAWQRALLTSTDDSPPLRRNLERVTRKLAELERRRDEAEQERRAKRERAPETIAEPADPDAVPPDQTQPQEWAPAPARDPDVLTAAQVEELLARLAAKEQEKRELRQAQRGARPSSGGRDW